RSDAPSARPGDRLINECRGDALAPDREQRDRAGAAPAPRFARPGAIGATSLLRDATAAAVTITSGNDVHKFNPVGKNPLTMHRNDVHTMARPDSCAAR